MSMAVTLTPEEIDLVLGDEFRAAIAPDFRDDFLVKVQEGMNGNYSIVDFGAGSEVVIMALRQFASGPESAAAKLIHQIEIAQQ